DREAVRDGPRQGSGTGRPADRPRLVRLEDLVLGGALGGGEAGLADERDDLLDRGGVYIVGRLVDVLLEERAAPVVGAEMQRDLTGRLAFREPGRLHVREIIEVE